ncbi:MAG TPA: response regulator transcription factor [Chloroflexota bacterium]
MRVIIADDHAVVRTGIRLLLSAHQDIVVVGEAKDGFEAIDLASELRPDVVVMDVAMAGLSGLEATRRLRQLQPDAKILMLTMHADEEYFFEAVRAGASGYVLKEASHEDVVEAVRTVGRGGVAFDSSLARKLLDDYLRRVDAGEEGESFGRLTDREREVLRLTAEGRSAREIAELLTLSPKTVEKHRTNLMEKLNLHNRAELVRYAVKKGLVDPNC